MMFNNSNELVSRRMKPIHLLQLGLARTGEATVLMPLELIYRNNAEKLIFVNKFVSVQYSHCVITTLLNFDLNDATVPIREILQIS